MPAAGPLTAATSGFVESTSTCAVFGGLIRVEAAARVSRSRMLDPVGSLIDRVSAMPLVSVSPAWSVYRKFRLVEPDPPT